LTSVDLHSCRLYGILDLSYVANPQVSGVANAMIDGGVDVIQLRAKGRAVEEVASVGRQLLEITRDRGVPLVINDHAEVARDLGADGVHVGQDDLSVTKAKQIAGSRCIVGKSTHTLEQATRAEEEGADYIGFGPLFATPTKPDYTPIGIADIREVHARVQLPIFCIGGIKLDNLPEVIAAGARRVVIVSGMLQAPDIEHYARAAKERLKSAAS
jgi:thiamine-phosphate pyrophosphorylase